MTHLPRTPTGFDAYFAKRMREPEFASAYAEARRKIDTTDALVRALDGARLLVGVSKADLARRIESRPEVVRRLFTARESNPTLATVLKVTEALGFHLELVPDRKSAARNASSRSRSPHDRARGATAVLPA